MRAIPARLARLASLAALLGALPPAGALAQDAPSAGAAAGEAQVSTAAAAGAVAPAAAEVPALSSAAAEGLEVSSAAETAEISTDTHRPELFLDELNHGLSIFNSLFTGMDRMISGREASSENKTSLNVGVKSVLGRYRPLKSTPRADLRVDMPSTLHRLKLVLQHSAPEDGSVSSSEERIANGQAQSEGTTLGGKYSLFSGKHLRQDIHIGTRPRIGAGRPFRVFAKFRLGAQSDFLGPWRSIVFTQAAWFSDPWLELSGGVYFTRALPRNITASINSSAEKTTLARKIDIFESVAFVKQIGRLDSVGLALQLHSVTVPYNRAELYAVVLAYRRNLYGGWFFGELSPAMEYPREHAFRPSPGVTAKLNMYFGYSGRGKR